MPSLLLRVLSALRVVQFETFFIPLPPFFLSPSLQVVVSDTPNIPHITPQCFLSNSNILTRCCGCAPAPSTSLQQPRQSSRRRRSSTKCTYLTTVSSTKQLRKVLSDKISIKLQVIPNTAKYLPPMYHTQNVLVLVQRHILSESRPARIRDKRHDEHGYKGEFADTHLLVR